VASEPEEQPPTEQELAVAAMRERIN
jgi:hypothetical protein